MYEIQFHPADIRKQVRYHFMSQRGFSWAVAGAVAIGILVLVGVVLAPLGIRALLLSGEHSVLRQQHRLQNEILAQREKALAVVQRQVDGARAKQQQMSLILGAPQSSQGLGGYPEETQFEVTVPEAKRALEHALKLHSDTKALLTLADELATFALAHEELTSAVPSICPIPLGNFVLTSPFGDRISPFTNKVDVHTGIDLAAREGTPVLATGDGRVVFAGRFPLSRNVRWWRYGNVVVLSHAGDYVTIYAHLEEIGVRRGQQLERGEQLGTVGNTGWSTSPHLHYEVRVAQKEGDEPLPMDPRIYILNYQWKGHEALLVQARRAPAPIFDPLPSRLKVR